MFNVPCPSSTFRTQAPELLQTDLGCVCLCVSCVTAAVGVDGGIRNVRAARGCSAVPVLSALSSALAGRMQVRGKSRSILSMRPRPTIPRSDTSV